MSKIRQNESTLCDYSEFFECRKRNMSKIILVLLLLFCEFLYKRVEIVAANGNTIIKSGPFLMLEKPSVKRLIITEPNLPHHLSCIATIEENFYYQNNTDYFYTWFRNDYELDALRGRRSGFMVNRNGTLRLPSNEKASGIYRCKINANNTAVLSESMTVIYPVLKRIRTSSYIKAKSNLSLTLNCPVISAPPANVSWYYDDEIISKVKKYNSYVIITNGSLVLRGVSSNDEGQYKCLAQNQFASRKIRQFSFTVTIDTVNVGDLQLKNSQLIPNLQNEIQYISRGENLTLLCYSLNESTNIEWWFQHTKNDEPIKISNHSTEFFNIFNADIENDQGIYTCKTFSDRQSFHVIVTMPPNILNPLPSYETLISASLAFSCNTEGNPPPKITWYHNGVHLNSSYSRYINGNELLLHSFDPDEDGIYQCFAENIAGEVYSSAEVRFRNKGEEIPRKNPLKNIRCFPHSFNTINITFESDITESLFIVHIVQENPHRWTSPFAPMKLNLTSHVVISSQLPIYRPFELITRVLFPISEIRTNNKPQQQTILSSLRSAPVTCCTQGLLLHQVQLGLNSTFLTWSQPELIGKKYFVLQFSINFTQPHPKKLIKNVLRGTTEHVELKSKDIQRKLENIIPFGVKMTSEILSRVENKNINEENTQQSESYNDIYSMILPANVSGVVLQNFQSIKIRVLLITEENENLAQDFRYVQWKTIDNGTAELGNTPFHLSTIESRMLGVYFQDIFNEACVEVCLWKIQFPFFNKEQPKCEQKRIIKSYITISGLKPMESYRLNLFSCESHAFYGQLDVKTLPDPPGTISNQRIIRNGGLKLNWDPPSQPNGKVYHYNILWTLGNSTHEANVPDCSTCSYKFPNLSESSKINVSIRVVGETGVGAPIYIDLRNINHQSLEIERSSAQTIYSGILIGILLSTLCILCFVTFFVLHKWRLKPSTQLHSQSEVNFTNLSSIGSQRTPVQNEITLQQECFEMQTLIPRSKKAEFLTNSQWLVTNDSDNPQKRSEINTQNENCLNDLNWSNENNINRNNCNNAIRAQNEIETVLPTGTLSFVYAALHHTGDNKAMKYVRSGVLNTTTDNGQKLLTNCLHQNKSNDIVCLLTEEEPVTRTKNPSEPNKNVLKTISTSLLPEEKENDSLTNYDRINSVSRIKKNHSNNNNVNLLLKNSHKGVNNRTKRKSNNENFSKEKLESMKEKSLFGLLSPEEATTPTSTDASVWANTLRVQTCRPSLGPNG